MVCLDLLQKTITLADPSIRLSGSSLDPKKLDSLGKEGLPVCLSSHVCHQSTHYLEEEFGDSSDVNVRRNNSLRRDLNARVDQNSPDADLPQMFSEFTAQESIKDVHFHSLGTEGACPERNFVRADPTYLKTLGQAHSGWIFGAIAELVDNSRDAKATR